MESMSFTPDFTQHWFSQVVVDFLTFTSARYSLKVEQRYYDFDVISLLLGPPTSSLRVSGYYKQ